MMDREYTPEMEIKYQSKLFVRFLQDYRKDCNLVPSDKVNIYYTLPNKNIPNIDKIISLTESSIRNKLHLTNHWCNIIDSFQTNYSMMDNEINIYYQLYINTKNNSKSDTKFVSNNCYQELTTKYPSSINMFANI